MFYEFIELEPFAQVRDELFTEEAFTELQIYLCKHPEAGTVIPGTSGCRKLRRQAKVKGKQGGARVIYFLRSALGQIVLVTAYGKNMFENIPHDWLRKIKEAYDNEID